MCQTRLYQARLHLEIVLVVFVGFCSLRAMFSVDFGRMGQSGDTISREFIPPCLVLSHIRKL